MLYPWEDESRCVEYRACSCTSLICWNDRVSDMGPLPSCPWLWGTLPKQSQSSPCLLLETWDLLALPAGFATQHRSPFSCSVQADLRVEVLQNEQGGTEASFWNTEKPRPLPRHKYGVTVEDILEGLPCSPIPVTRGNCASTLSQGISEPKGANGYQRHSVGCGKCLVQLLPPSDACSGAWS